MNQIFDFFLDAYKNASATDIVLEIIVFVFGITSVIYAKRENILVYPTGLVATIITVYLLYKAEYFGDMMMNFYYSVMSLYGWWNWARKKENEYVLPLSRTNTQEKLIGIALFFITMFVTYLVYSVYDYKLEIPNYIDIFTSGIFFTAMWYMATKKLANWTLWIIADLITIPLYAYRGLGILSLQYLIFTILAIQGYKQWKKSIDNKKQIA
ncbi:nicotinamide riboside transporter PnuC [uncultured Lacinutrix sp.]|uniref:nicotinamide riboside transporter PnuC n=1 Tax=uncultured Lacinutrix sp. TaxID=574032 RepID=UPI0026026AF2|nr:nicotinamide riboside transporter PnuC [uncultured Lacinutrix sp.]